VSLTPITKFVSGVVDIAEQFIAGVGVIAEKHSFAIQN
jgi:hypothetical protein